MKNASSIQVLSTPRTGSSAFGKLLSESGFSQASFSSIESQSASEFNTYGYFENSELNLCLDVLIWASFNHRNSFLFNSGMKPIRETMENNFTIHRYTTFDLDQSVVRFPKDYTTNIKKYTGHDWDVWGLTRMQKSGKWHKAYSRAGVETPAKALELLKSAFKYLEGATLNFIKDPRLIYLLPMIDSEITGVIVRRNPNQILMSMRNHYGPNLFTHNILYDDWVSNHFNYRVLPQEFDEYMHVYDSFEKYATNNFDIKFIDYEKLYDSDELRRLSDQLGVTLAWKNVK